MKTKKWIWWTLAIILVVGMTAGAGFTGYRIGVVQGANLAADGTLPDFFMHGKSFDDVHGGQFGKGGFDHSRGDSGGRGDFGRHSGFSPFGFIFGLFRLTVFAGLIWLGYTLVQRSGWRLVKTEAAAAPVQPAVEDVPTAQDENKESE